MGEQLSSQIRRETLPWLTIKYTSEDSILARMKCANFSYIQGEFLDAFTFDHFWLLQQAAGTYDLVSPVFHFCG